jgi:hypothetical protein
MQKRRKVRIWVTRDSIHSQSLFWAHEHFLFSFCGCFLPPPILPVSPAPHCCITRLKPLSSAFEAPPSGLCMLTPCLCYSRPVPALFCPPVPLLMVSHHSDLLQSYFLHRCFLPGFPRIQVGTFIIACVSAWQVLEWELFFSLWLPQCPGLMTHLLNWI